MFAVVQIGSTQYSVSEKDEILVDQLELDEGKNYMVEKVLLCSEFDGGKVMVGMPYLTNVKVETRVVGHEKGEKIRIFKMKPKKRYERTRGHRSLYTRLKVLKISVLSSTPSKAAASKETPKAAAETPKKAAPKKAAVKKVAVKKVAVKKVET